MARAPSNPPADGEGFLSRWSRRKVEGTRAPEANREPAAPLGAAPLASDPGAAFDALDSAGSPVVPKDVAAPKPEPEPLPAIDSLSAESDFSVFLRPGVPDGMQRDALRKLWSTVPSLAPIEIAETHMGDFNDVPTFPDGLKDTIYDAVRGFVDRVTDPNVEVASTGAASRDETEPPVAESTPAVAASPPDRGRFGTEDSDSERGKS